MARQPPQTHDMLDSSAQPNLEPAAHPLFLGSLALVGLVAIGISIWFVYMQGHLTALPPPALPALGGNTRATRAAQQAEIETYQAANETLSTENVALKTELERTQIELAQAQSVDRMRVVRGGLVCCTAPLELVGWHVLDQAGREYPASLAVATRRGIRTVPDGESPATSGIVRGDLLTTDVHGVLLRSLADLRGGDYDILGILLVEIRLYIGLSHQVEFVNIFIDEVFIPLCAQPSHDCRTDHSGVTGYIYLAVFFHLVYNILCLFNTRSDR